MVTDLTTTVGMVFADVVFPNFPVGLIPYYDTIVWVCLVVASVLPMASKVMSFLEMSMYALVTAMPALPWIGRVVSSNHVDKMTERYEYLNEQNLHQGDVFWTAGLILILISIIISLISLGASQQKIVIIRIPKHMETLSRGIWVFFLCVVGYCTILTQENVENVFGSDSFFVFQVVVLVVNHLFCFHKSKSIDLGTQTILHSIPGNLWSTGAQSPSPQALKKLRPKIEEYIQSNNAKAWGIYVGDINLKNGDKGTRDLHAWAQPFKNNLQTMFKTYTQTAGETQYVLALNCVPNTVTFTVFIFGILYVATSDVANLRNNTPLLSVTVWQYFANMKDNARGNVTTPVVSNFTNPMCPITVDHKHATSLKDAGKKENTTQQPPETNTTDEMPSGEVPDGSVQDSDNTVMLAVGTAVTSGVGYGIYWMMTQG